MPTATALRLCPQAIVVPPRLGYYAEVSEQIREIFDSYTPLIEPLSLDEAFLDVTGSEGLLGSSVEIGRAIRQAIRSQLRLTASVGVAANKFLAKVASDLNKPDGFVVVLPAQIQEFLDPLPVGRLWGVGRVASQVFDRLGVKTIGEMRQMSVDALRQHFGQTGEHLWQLAHGIDQRRVIPDREAKSISHETTFAADIGDLETLRAWIAELALAMAPRSGRYRSAAISDRRIGGSEMLRIAKKSAQVKLPLRLDAPPVSLPQPEEHERRSAAWAHPPASALPTAAVRTTKLARAATPTRPDVEPS